MEQPTTNYSAYTNNSKQTTYVPMPDFTNTARQMSIQNSNFFTPPNISSGLNHQQINYKAYQQMNSFPSASSYFNYNQNPMQGLYLPYNNASMQSTNPFYRNGDYNLERDAERDVEYLKELYPKTCKKLLLEIEEECDKLEYEGSCMFDEYPDRVCLDRIIDTIYNRVKDREEFKAGLEATTKAYDQMEASQVSYYPTRCCNWLHDMIELMLFHEFYNRRRRYRKRRRWF